MFRIRKPFQIIITLANTIGWSHSAAMIESKRVPNWEQYVMTYINVTCVTSTRKTRNSRVSRRYVNIVSITLVCWRNVGRHASYVFFPCRRYACYVYARRDTLFWPTELNMAALRYESYTYWSSSQYNHCQAWQLWLAHVVSIVTNTKFLLSIVYCFTKSVSA